MLDINLATRVYIDNRRITATLWLVGISLFLFIVINLSMAFFNFKEIQQIKSSVKASLIESSKAGKQISDQQYQLLLEKIHFANGIIEQRKLNWLVFLDSLEQVVPEGVTFTALDYDKQSSTYKMSGYAMDFRKVRKLFESLGMSPQFQDVYLVSQSRIKVSEQQQGVAFTLTAKVQP